MTGADIARWRWLTVLLLAVVVSRLPLLFTCYSSDPDAWRVVTVGKTFWQTGVYSASRFPGYPVHEIGSGLTALAGGPLLSNATTLLFSLALIVAWYLFTEKNTSSPRLLTVLLAFTPLFWIDSAATMDYAWSLLFIILSLGAAQQRRGVLAGICLGIAVGCRPTNVVAVVPVFVLLSLHRPAGRVLGSFGLSLLASGLVVFSPVLLTYGPAGWIRGTITQAHTGDTPLLLQLQSFLYRLVYSIGPLGFLALVIALLSGRHTLIRLLRERDALVIACTWGVIVFVALFAVFPLDRSYVLPAFPFLFIIAGRVMSQRALIATALCIFSFAFVNPDVVRHSRVIGTPGINVHAGIVFEEWMMRRQIMQEREALGRLPIAGKAVVMLGISDLYLPENPAVEPDSSLGWSERGDFVAHSVKHPQVYFVSEVPMETVGTLRREGYTFYYLDWTKALLQKATGLNPLEAGIIPITL